jgi:cbb3-type cytochrome c oxidase subunit III
MKNIKTIALLLGLTGVSAALANPALIKEGETAYNANCVFCHQADAIGKAGAAPSLTNPEFLAISSNEFLKGTISDGRPGTSMVPYSHLGDETIEAIVAYLRSHETMPRRAEDVDNQPAAEGDAEHGQELFSAICSTCHGRKGDGYLTGGSGTAIGMQGFLDKVSDGYIRETIAKGRSNTRMLGFQGPEGNANLTDQEVDDIIVYMRTLEH